MNSRSNKLIELFRGIAAVMIVFIHAPFPAPVGKYISALGRFAVPFFLMVSGYFSYGLNQRKRLKKKAKDTLMIIFFGGGICAVWNSIISYLGGSSPFRWIMDSLRLGTLFRLLAFNYAAFLNSVFYYFFMLLYVYVLFILFGEHIKLNNRSIVASGMLFLTGYVINHFTSLDWYYVGNTVLTGIPMFLFGRYLNENASFVEKQKDKEFLLIFIGIGVTLVELNVLPKGDYVYIGQAIVAATMLIICLNHHSASVPNQFVFFGTNCSLYLIITHHEVIKTLALYLEKNVWWFPLTVLLLSSIVSVIAYYFIRYVKTQITKPNATQTN